MPRSAKPKPIRTPYPTGHDSQPAQAPTGLPYGEHQQLVEAQHAVPVPGPGTVPVPPAPPGDQAILHAATQMPFQPVDLYGAPERPEPLTAGLPIGAGPGPEAMGPRRSNVADTLELLARTTGDDSFRELAAKARYRP